jgi:hypothetical protein
MEAFVAICLRKLHDDANMFLLADVAIASGSAEGEMKDIRVFIVSNVM